MTHNNKETELLQGLVIDPWPTGQSFESRTQLTVAKKSYNLVSNWQSMKGDLQPLWNSKVTGSPAQNPQKKGQVRRPKIKPVWKPGCSEQQRTSPAALLCADGGPRPSAHKQDPSSFPDSVGRTAPQSTWEN